MIAPRKLARRKNSPPAWHDGFLAMAPKIRQYALFAFRRMNEEAREEAVAETIADALVAYVRLFEQGKVDLAYPSVLARWAVAHIRAGRRVGGHLNTRDVLSEAARKRHGHVVQSLNGFDKHSDEWIEATIEDTQTPVLDQVAFRCDFPAWLATHTTRDRRIAELLALGHSTSEVAKRFEISSGRVSQLRRELHDSWSEFHGEETPDETAAIAEPRGPADG